MNSTNYFSDCTTISEAKIKFKNLCKVHHPDVGGDSKIMAEIIRQYDSFIPSTQEHTNRYRGYGGRSFGNMGPDFSNFANDYANFKCSSIPFDHPIHEELRKTKYGNSLKEEIIKRDDEIIRLTKELQVLKQAKKSKGLCDIIKAYVGIDDKST